MNSDHEPAGTLRSVWRAAASRFRRRHLAVIPVIILHAVLLLFLIRVKDEPVPTVSAAGELQVFNVAPQAPVPEPPVPPPPVPLPPVEEVAPLLVIELPIRTVPATAPPDASAAAASPGVTGISCDLTDVVQRALRDSESVGTALLRIPVGARSVANAVMLWDGAWVSPGAVGGEIVLGPIRTEVIAAVEAAPENCRTDVQAGPRLLLIPSARETLTLAVGSGSWRWGDLARIALPPLPKP